MKRNKSVNSVRIGDIVLVRSGSFLTDSQSVDLKQVVAVESGKIMAHSMNILGNLASTSEPERIYIGDFVTVATFAEGEALAETVLVHKRATSQAMTDIFGN